MRADLDPQLDTLTDAIIGAAFAVSNALGHGFLEGVYKNALLEELGLRGLQAAKESPFPVFYKGRQVGLYVADIVVNGQVIVELKAIEALGQAHAAQVLNYLKASRIPVGLLLNFGRPRLELKRIIL